MSAKPAIAARMGHSYAILLVVATLALALSVSISGIILIARAAPPVLVQPPANILPGNPLPDDVKCIWPPYRSNGMLYCNTILDENRVYLTYDPRREMIIRSSVEIDRQTVGDLLLAWGTPTGLKRSPWSAQIQWGGRYVYAYAHPFKPSNPIFFVFYTLEPESNPPWSGFGNREAR
jgi:hypothetical protein